MGLLSCSYHEYIFRYYLFIYLSPVKLPQNNAELFWARGYFETIAEPSSFITQSTQAIHNQCISKHAQYLIVDMTYDLSLN